MLRPKLRDGLGFSIQEQADRRVCIVEDSQASKFHRVGLSEYAFLRALDGVHTVSEILAQMVHDGGGDAFTEVEAMQILRWAYDNGLLSIEAGRAVEQSSHKWQQALSWINPLMIKIPLARPDAFFGKIIPVISRAMGAFGGAIWLIIILIGISQVSMNWERFAGSMDGILARDNWLWLGLAWVFLKTIHELAHGVYCKYFGAGVREIGVILVLFMPMGFVDATASLTLPSKWRRIMVSCAGMYVEFFVAALAAIVWTHTSDGMVNTIAHNIIVTGTVVTLFFNANPLMRFDGYYILVDLLEISNLSTRGQQFVSGLWKWLLIGGSALRPAPFTKREDYLVAIYGVAAAAWQWMVSAGLMVGAAQMWHGGGLVFAAIGLVAWFGPPLLQFAHALSQSGSGDFNGLFRIALRTLVLIGVVAGILVFPFHKSVVSPGVVEYADTCVVRAECPGFVSRVLVKDGEIVKAGDPLVELRNDELASELEGARLSLQSDQLRARLAYTRADVASFQEQQAKADGERKTCALKEKFLATLTIRAPISGRVVRRHLDESQGLFFKTGEEILRMGRADSREVTLLISQENVPHFRSALKKSIQVKIDGRSTVYPATLERIDAGATREMIQPALTALAGGPIAIRRGTRDDDSEAAPRSQDYELAEPHFRATALLIGDQSATLPAGETVLAKARSGISVSLWGELQGEIDHWLKRITTRRSGD